MDMKRRSARGSYFDLVEAELIEDERRNNELIYSFDQITEILAILIEKKSVFDKCVQLLESPQMLSTNISASNMEEGTGINFLAGTIKAEDEMRMKRMVFRISRGRAIPSFFDFEKEGIIKVNSIKLIL